MAQGCYGTIFSLQAFWLEPTRFEVLDIQMTLKRWPKTCRATRFGVFGGQYCYSEAAGGQFVGPEPIVRELSKLHAGSGVSAVLGNDDWR